MKIKQNPLRVLCATGCAIAKLTALSCAAAPGSSPAPIVLGYYPSWSSGLTPEKINYRLFTHIVHAFITVDEHGRIKMGDNMPSKVLTKLGHAAGAQVVLSLGGEESGKSLNAATQGAEAMAALANAVIDVAKENNYDGIDVDWEASEGTDHANLVDFVKLLRKKLKAWRPDALLLMAVPGTDWEGKWFDGPKLEPEVDFIQVMSYEFHGPWFNPQDHTYSQSGYNSPLYESDIDPVDGHNYSFQKSLEYWEKKGFQKSKIVMGIPCFGHGFAVNGWGKAPVKASKYPDIDFRKIKPLLAAGWQQHWDDQAKEPWLSSPAGDEIITYDDEKSAAAKGEWARKAGVRGIFFWEISQDYVDDHNTLVEAARAELGLPK